LTAALADQLLTIDLEQRPELDQLIDVDSGWVHTRNHL
jgi:hypothetical protein